MAITYEEVEAVINGLVAEGLTPSIPRIREGLGNTGSPNTIQRYKKAWQDSAPVVQRIAVELPEDLKKSLVSEIERQSASAKSEIEKKLVSAEADLIVLSTSGEATEAELDKLRLAYEELSSDKIRLEGVDEERVKEVDRVNGELKLERESSESTRVSLAKIQLEVDNLKQDKEVLRGKREKFEGLYNVEKEKAREADKELAIKATKLESEEAKVKVLTDDIRKIELSFKAKDDRISHLEFLVETKSNEIGETRKSLEQVIADIKDEHKKAINLLSAELKAKSDEVVAIKLSASVLEGRLTELKKPNNED